MAADKTNRVPNEDDVNTDLLKILDDVDKMFHFPFAVIVNCLPLPAKIQLIGELKRKIIHSYGATAELVLDQDIESDIDDDDDDDHTEE